MKLLHEFYRLPLSFDVERLKQEVLAFSEEEWQPHPDNFPGNASIPLVSVKGEINNEFVGPMQETAALKDSPYLRQAIAAFGEVVGRSRLMRLAPGCEVPIHSDTNYHWLKRVRIHIPIITDQDVAFFCGDKQVHMAAGEAWIFDSWKYHYVQNNGQTLRVHLVIDVAGSSQFWNLVNRSEAPCEQDAVAQEATRKIAFNPSATPTIKTEKYNAPLVMSPGEMDGLLAMVRDEAVQVSGQQPNWIADLDDLLNQLKYDWRSLWSEHGEQESGWTLYHQLRLAALAKAKQLDDGFVAGNGAQIKQILIYCVLMPALNVSLANNN